VRIVSLLPSATEIICSLGLLDVLVGVTHECDFPSPVLDLPKVTETVIPHEASSSEIDSLVRSRLQSSTALYSLNMDVLHDLNPDLIITQALCDVCAVSESEVLEAIKQLKGKPQLINLEPMSLGDVLKTILMVGDATGLNSKSQSVVNDLKKRIQSVKSRTALGLKWEDYPRVAFFEWIDPLFNPGHWNPTLIELAGGIDSLGNKNQPSRTTAWEEVLAVDPEFMFIACCGFDLDRTFLDIEILKTYPDWQELSCVKSNKVYVTDGNSYFSRSGPRLVDSLEIISHAMHPHIHPRPLYAPAAECINQNMVV
jgi:iron complex transport system substrate-binding protein